MATTKKAYRRVQDVPPPGYKPTDSRAKLLRDQAAWERANGAQNKRDQAAYHKAFSGADVGRVSLKKGLKKGARGVKRGVRAAGKGIKAVAKAVGKQAARPVRALFLKLGRRRAKYLAWTRRKSRTANLAEKAEAGVWTVTKFRNSGPAGKLAVIIMKHTWGTGVGASIMGDNAIGMTGVEIAAVVASVTGAMSKLISSMNKPGEAPANPESAPSEEGESGASICGNCATGCNC